MSVVGDPSDIAIVETGMPGLGPMFSALRRSLSAFWMQALAPDTASLARALILGESHVLSYAQKERFRRTGTAHLLSVSGLHLGLSVLFAFILLMFALKRIPYLTRRLDVGRIAAALSIPAAIGFTYLSGARVPVVRACVMVISALFARVFGRGKGAMEALTLAGVFLLLIEPRALSTPGFQLSFAAVLGFFAVSSRHRTKWKPDPLDAIAPQSFGQKWARQGFAAVLHLLSATTAATAATTPLLLYHFGYVSVVAVPVNLLAVPLTGFVILPGLLMSSFMSVICPAIATPIAEITGILLNSLDRALGYISTLPCTIDNPGPILSLGLLAVCLAALIYLGGKKQMAAAAMAVGLMLAVLSLWLDSARFQKGRLTIDFLDVGQGDATLITYPNGQHWLVDAGGAWRGQFDAGERIVAPVLRGLDVRQLDVAVVSHPDVDHVGGMPAVIDAFPVTEIWDNGQGEIEGADERYHALLETARSRRIPIRQPPDICGTRKIGSVAVSVLHPCQAGSSYDPGRSPNDNSLVLFIQHGSVSLLLPGDIGRGTEQYLVEQRSIQPVTLLKLAHHGSSTSSGPSFLNAASPRIAIVSAGRFNRHRLPHPTIVQQMRTRGIGLYRTALHGGIRAISNGSTIQIETAADVKLPGINGFDHSL